MLMIGTMWIKHIGYDFLQIMVISLVINLVVKGSADDLFNKSKATNQYSQKLPSEYHSSMIVQLPT